MKHFKLTSESEVNIYGVTLFRVELTINCQFGKIGDKGGWVEKEENLKGKNAWIYGDAQIFAKGVIWGGEIRGGVIWGGVIWGGEWKKSPLQIQGTKHFVNVSNKFMLKIGCNEFSFEYWKEEFKEIGIANGYTPEEIEEYGLYIDLAIKIYGLKDGDIK